MRSRSRFRVARQRQVGHGLQRSARAPAVVSPADVSPPPAAGCGAALAIAGGGRCWRPAAAATAPSRAPRHASPRPASSPATRPSPTGQTRRPRAPLRRVRRCAGRRARAAPARGLPVRHRAGAARPGPSRRGDRSPWPSTATRPPGHKIGSLLVNPGGPGASGVDSLPTVVSRVAQRPAAHFDVVGFDPPGVARTAPITCLDSAGLGPVLPRSIRRRRPPPASTPWSPRPAPSPPGCEARSGAELPYVSTVDAARDMDVLRAALGDSQAHLPRLLLRHPPGGDLRRAVPDPRAGHGARRRPRPGRPPITASWTNRSAASTVSCSSSSPPAPAPRRVPWKPGGNLTAAFEALLAAGAGQPAARPAARPGPSARPSCSTAPRPPCTRRRPGTTWPRPSRPPATATAPTFSQLFDCYTGRQRRRELQQRVRGQRRHQLPATRPAPPWRPDPSRRSRRPRRPRPCSGC